MFGERIAKKILDNTAKIGRFVLPIKDSKVLVSCTLGLFRKDSSRSNFLKNLWFSGC